MDGRRACPGEVVTYTCTVTQGTGLEWIVEPFLSSNTLRFTPDTTPADQMQGCNDFVSIDCAVFDFQSTVSITNINAGMTLADLTSTLRFTARSQLNGTVVQCRIADGNAMLVTQEETLDVAGMFLLLTRVQYCMNCKVWAWFIYCYFVYCCFIYFGF